MAIMKVNDLIEKLKKLYYEPTVYYSVAGGDWCKWNGSAWNTDCVCTIKGILWGFDFDKSADHGGADYGSNGVYDDTPDQLIERCFNVSADFSKIEEGEFMFLPGHCGIYIGNGLVLESTMGWGANGVTISEVARNGRRTKNGIDAVNNYWFKHGKLPYIDYSKPEPEPAPEKLKFKIGDRVVINGDLFRTSMASEAAGSVKNKVTSITRIAEGALHPYNTSGDLGWMNEEDIKLDGEGFQIGDRVRMEKGANIYGSIGKFASFVYESILYVREINGNRVIVSTVPSGAITGAVHKKFLTKVD